MNYIAKLCTAITLVSLVTGCGDRADRYEELSDTWPYYSDRAYSQQLRPCAIAETSFGSCSLQQLPVLGMESEKPSIDDIMGRLLVSHEWMAKRFEMLLHELPDDFLQLFSAVTVVVIDGDVRPSYYTNITGAIYLDPDRLWMDLDEIRVISDKPDYRDGYDDPMSFRRASRKMIGDDYAYKHYGLDSTEPRPLHDMVIPMASLLAHELAHANDYLPSSRYNDIDRSRGIYWVTEDLKRDSISRHLKENHPLQSYEMFRLADILFSGVTPSEEDTKVTAEEVGAYFNSDIASYIYAYTSSNEDFAMLVEDTLMKMHFDVDRDQAFIIRDERVEEQFDGSRSVIGWGIRNRLGDEEVKARARIALEYIIPDRDFSDFFNSLPLPTMLPYGYRWGDTLSLDPDVLSTKQPKIYTD